MKLRRPLALVAATAAIAPAVLLAAPVAYATDDSPSPTVSETAPTEEESTPAEDDTTPTTDETTPAEDETTPAEEETSPAASDSASPSASATVSVCPSASATTSPAPGPVECEDGDEPKFDDDLHTSLSGLASKIVAGNGFHGFKLDVKNTGSHSYQRVDLGVFAAQVDEDDFFIDTSYLTLQFKDPATGKWTDISLDENDEGAGYLGYTDIKAKESFSIDLRLAVDKISTRRQCERRCPSATPDSTASQVSIGPDTTEPANAYASDEAGKRAPHPCLTRCQQSQH